MRLFLTHVLKIPLQDIGEKVIHRLIVDLKYPITKERRIDIVLRTEMMDVFIPIEVKIYAPDQEKQCIDYLEYAHKFIKKAKIYYLTL